MNEEEVKKILSLFKTTDDWDMAIQQICQLESKPDERTSEEVKKGMYYSDRCKFCHEFGEKVEPYLCEICRNRICEWLNSKGWSILQKERG